MYEVSTIAGWRAQKPVSVKIDHRPAARALSWQASFTEVGTVVCVWLSSLKVMSSIPSLTQPKKAHQGGNAQVESYLSDPQEGTV